MLRTWTNFYIFVNVLFSFFFFFFKKNFGNVPTGFSGQTSLPNWLEIAEENSGIIFRLSHSNLNFEFSRVPSIALNSTDASSPVQVVELMAVILVFMSFAATESVRLPVIETS